MHTKEEKLNAFSRLLDVMDSLRERCPWNAAQTMDTIRPMTEEEVYELSDAIIRKDMPDVAKEIGDLLYHMVFYARIAQESGDFDIADSLDRICDKMVFRHPHVFGPASEKKLTAKDIADNWELVKAREKDGNKTIMSGIPDAMPAVLKALSMQEKARGCGFDWEKKEDVWDKVREELGELEAELKREDAERSAKELGDFLFSVINAARLYHINPDNALEETNQKFIRRFNYVERKAKEAGKSLKDMTLGEMDALWDEAKRQERTR